jgi:hypothetical protein
MLFEKLIVRLRDKAVHMCPVCLSNVNRARVYRLKKCNHQFCKQCLRHWIHTKHFNCPLCRQTMIAGDMKALFFSAWSKELLAIVYMDDENHYDIYDIPAA